MYKQWKLSDLKDIPKNKYKVFSTFSCGGGSTMGYKLSGFDVIGINEIDPLMVKIYTSNFSPKYIFEEDIRTLYKKELPKDLYDIDILDGSPPCSVFSSAGKREKDWGKSKKFREGQAEQTLDDLYFEFIKLTDTLKPKIFITENVKGLVMGSAKGYLKEIVNKFEQIGYTTQVFLVNAAFCGVPQRRERIFIIGHRKDLLFKPLEIKPNLRPIYFHKIKTGEGILKSISPAYKKILPYTNLSDRTLAQALLRLGKKGNYFTTILIKDNEVPPTLISGGTFIVANEKRLASTKELQRIQSFPEDYNFVRNESYEHIKYVLGMSVPPYMMREVSRCVREQWLDKL